MAVFKCSQCGTEQETRCKPRTCSCGGKDTYTKKDAPAQAPVAKPK